MTAKEKEIENAMDDLIKTVQRLEIENSHLKKVLKTTHDESLAGGFVLGLSYRKGLELNEFDRRMLKAAGNCISRIINQEEAET